ncbi:MAG TPA: hypothetical protein VGL05_26510 [Kribbella sp.]
MVDGSAQTPWHRLSKAGAGAVSLIYPAVAVFVLALAIADLPNAFRAARNDGVPGTFVVTHKDCRPWWEKGGGCTVHGDFVSKDTTIALRGVLFEGNPGDVGAVVPAQVIDPDSGVIDKVDSDEWVFNVLLALGTAGYLVWRIVRAVRRRRVTSGTGG